MRAWERTDILVKVEEVEEAKEKARDRSPVLFETGCGQEQAAGALLQCVVRVRASRAARVVADDAGLVGAERALAALANNARQGR